MNADVRPNNRDICQRLLEMGNLPRSQCGALFVRSLKPLFEASVVRWEKAAGGQRLVVVNQAGYQRWFSQNFPDGKLPKDIQLSRIRGVAQFRKSKALRSNLPVIVCVKSTQDGVLMKNGLPVETTLATKDHGIFAFQLKNPTDYSLTGKCVLIENLAVFQLFERLKLNASCAIWTGGISSNRFLNWLSSNAQNGLRVLHLPDYDPVGLKEFLRCHKRLGDCVSLHIPENLSSLFEDHSNLSILADTKNQHVLLQLRKCENAVVQRIVSLIDKHNGGLEHEALFIIPKTSTKIVKSHPL